MMRRRKKERSNDSNFEGRRKGLGMDNHNFLLTFSESDIPSILAVF